MPDICTVHVGLGPIGLQIVKATAASDVAEPVAGSDISPDLAGKTLGELCGCESLGGLVYADIEEAIDVAQAGMGAHVLVLATGSKMPDIREEIIIALGKGLNVVSTAEELTWPWLRHPDLAEEINELAQECGVTVVGTGINPGFILDLLPLLLCRPCQVVRSVTAKRIVNVSLRRPQLQKKVGSGLTPEAYRELADEGKAGHVGLGESAAMVAAGLGWDFDGVEETISPVIAKEPTGTEHFSIEAGQVMGSHQTAVVRANGGRLVELINTMTHGEPDPRDEIIVDGDPPIHLRIEGGIFGDTATAGCTVNILRQTVEALPGLLTVKDLPVG